MDPQTMDPPPLPSDTLRNEFSKSAKHINLADDKRLVKGYQDIIERHNVIDDVNRAKALMTQNEMATITN